MHGGKRKPWTSAQPKPTERLRGRANQRRRDALFAREPLCRTCAKAGRVTVATIRDHIIPLAEGGTEGTIENEQPLCQTCSDLKTQAESDRGAKRPFGKAGVSIIREVVTGAPGAGKTTYVERTRHQGVIVWDLDAIAATVAQSPTYPRQPHVSSACHAMRTALVNHLHSSAQTPFILIVTERADAELIASRLSARLVTVGP